MNNKFTKSLLAGVLGVALTFSGATLAMAEDAPVAPVTQAPTVAKKDKQAIAVYKAAKADYQTAVTEFKAAKESYKQQQASYKALMVELKPALVAYGQAKKVIGQTFAAAVKSAKAAYTQAISGGVSAEAKLAAKIQFDEAKAAAAASRAAAITALGTAPVKPAAPVKPTKPEKPTR